jgi:hypothetical protein
MLDWFGSGIFGGLFGPALVRLLRRYKLRSVFIAGALGSEVILFFTCVKMGGWHLAWERMIEMAFTPVGILFPLGMGALCVVGLVLCAPDLIGRLRTKKPDDPHN